jgi:hypothetical protein
MEINNIVIFVTLLQVVRPLKPSGNYMNLLL